MHKQSLFILRMRSFRALNHKNVEAVTQISQCSHYHQLSGNNSKHIKVKETLNRKIRPLLQLQALSVYQERTFWGIDVAFNKVDEERVKLAGADRAAAEWVLRNGGSIKWSTSSTQLSDFNLLPSTEFENYKLEEIDLTATDVISLGFEHLKNLEDVKKIKIHSCRSVSDDSLECLAYVGSTLKFLEISNCPNITDKGLDHLIQLKKLEHLVLYDLPAVPSLTQTVSRLQKSMPWCKIDTAPDSQSLKT
ncbi:unnamed protein product [Lymnaea stagnalis]|uniref:Mitochondrial ATP synthase regulatory component factor B n=1 Tax=Lymnaea stagnalis TaxID=6523 RepID=A0AAV2I6P0_LYMST